MSAKNDLADTTSVPYEGGTTGGKTMAETKTLQPKLLRRIMDAIWPALGGNHTDAETWNQVAEEILAELPVPFYKIKWVKQSSASLTEDTLLLNGKQIARLRRDKPAEADPEGGWWWLVFLSTFTNAESGPYTLDKAKERAIEQLKEWLELDEELQPVATDRPFRPTHRHVARGTEYELKGEALTQTDRPLADYDRVNVYAGKAGDLWVRPVEEFSDGRFEEIAKKVRP